MIDLIERQKAIDAMCSVCGNDCDKSEFVYGAPQDEQVILCPEHYALTSLPSAQPEIIYCKDCVKHNKGHGYYLDGTVIGIKDCCPLVEIRGMAQGHEFDYQYCSYAERRTEGNGRD